MERLSESGRYIMELLWEKGSLQAREIVAGMTISRAYKRGTTYKLLERLCAKGFVEKTGERYTPVYSREQVVRNETQSLLDRFFKGSFSNLAAQFVQSETLDEAELNEIKRIVDARKREG